MNKTLSRKLPKLLQISTILLVTSCAGIDFNPDAHKANHKIQGIVNERKEVVKCFEPDFSNFVCMKQDKWEELLVILKTSKGISPYERKEILSSLQRTEVQPEQQILSPMKDAYDVSTSSSQGTSEAQSDQN